MTNEDDLDGKFEKGPDKLQSINSMDISRNSLDTECLKWVGYFLKVFWKILRCTNRTPESKFSVGSIIRLFNSRLSITKHVTLKFKYPIIKRPLDVKGNFE